MLSEMSRRDSTGFTCVTKPPDRSRIGVLIALGIAQFSALLVAVAAAVAIAA